MSYKYEGVVKVIRRSRPTLIFSMGVPIVKTHGPLRLGFLLLVTLSLEVQTPSSDMCMGIIMRMCPTNMRLFCRLLSDLGQLQYFLWGFLW